jgi:hypothetical protein
MRTCIFSLILNKQERLQYIFPKRIGWFDALLADIRTLITGGQHYKNKPSHYLGGTYGAGNVSIAELVCTGLELAAAHYTGKTRYNVRKNTKHKSYQAAENVKQFIIKYFPTQSHSKEVTHVLWDAIRNGTHHLFTPKSIKYKKDIVEFMFYVERSRKKSHVTRNGNTILINVNSIEFYRMLKKAFQDYKKDIQADRTLQMNFYKASKSIERNTVINYNGSRTMREIISEVKYLSKQLTQTGSFNLF